MGHTMGVGRQAPPFTLPTTDGGRISLDDYRGDWFPVLLFFGRDDPEADARVAALSAAADRVWGVRGQLVGITATAGDGSARPDADRPAFPVLIDHDGAVARSYGAWDEADGRIVPTSRVVDRAGRIVWTGRPNSLVTPSKLMDVFREVVR